MQALDQKWSGQGALVVAANRSQLEHAVVVLWSRLDVSPLMPYEPMGHSGVSCRFRLHVRQSGVPIEGSAYALRHTFAMRLLDSGVGMKAIGDLMGHHCLASTSAYLRIQTDMLREVALEVPVDGGVR